MPLTENLKLTHSSNVVVLEVAIAFLTLLYILNMT